MWETTVSAPCVLLRGPEDTPIYSPSLSPAYMMFPWGHLIYSSTLILMAGVVWRVLYGGKKIGDQPRRDRRRREKSVP